MKINCGPTWQEEKAALEKCWEEKKAALEKWHLWFAWRPVRVGSGDCRWLETVQRKGVLVDGIDDDWWTWEYKA